jgi:hypothetical protein
MDGIDDINELAAIAGYAFRTSMHGIYRITFPIVCIFAELILSKRARRARWGAKEMPHLALGEKIENELFQGRVCARYNSMRGDVGKCDGQA